MDCDVVIVGGGLAGIRTGHILSQYGLSVVILEAKEVIS
jgi:flavin-dependent dehydrogenase